MAQGFKSVKIRSEIYDKIWELKRIIELRERRNLTFNEVIEMAIRLLEERIKIDTPYVHRACFSPTENSENSENKKK